MTQIIDMDMVRDACWTLEMPDTVIFYGAVILPRAAYDDRNILVVPKEAALENCWYCLFHTHGRLPQLDSEKGLLRSILPVCPHCLHVIEQNPGCSDQTLIAAAQARLKAHPPVPGEYTYGGLKVSWRTLSTVLNARRRVLEDYWFSVYKTAHVELDALRPSPAPDWWPKPEPRVQRLARRSRANAVDHEEPGDPVAHINAMLEAHTLPHRS